MLGPPRMAFASSTSVRNTNKLPLDSPDRPPLRDADSRDRFNFRNIKRDGETETREGRSNLLRPKRAEGEDNEGWSTVKPRKSFGTEGAERFNGRMGVHREDRRFKDREDRDVKDRPQRGFDSFSRDKDVENQQESEVRRNGAGRGRTESWFRTENDGPPTPRDRNSNGDRFKGRKIDRGIAVHWHHIHEVKTLPESWTPVFHAYTDLWSLNLGRKVVHQYRPKLYFCKTHKIR